MTATAEAVCDNNNTFYVLTGLGVLVSGERNVIIHLKITSLDLQSFKFNFYNKIHFIGNEKTCQYFTFRKKTC